MLRLRQGRYFVIVGVILTLITYIAVYQREAMVTRIMSTAHGMPEAGGESTPATKSGRITAEDLLKESTTPLRPSKDASQKLIAPLPMSYGTASRPAYSGLPSPGIADLPREHLPSPAAPHNRLVIVGDVHGQLSALQRLLDKVEFNKSTDHLVLAGDMVTKGPDSRGVVQLAMDLNASAVRGNHEDRVLLAQREEEAAAAARKKFSSSSSSLPPSAPSSSSPSPPAGRRGISGWLSSLFGSAPSKGGSRNATAVPEGPKPGTEAEVAVVAGLSRAQLQWLAGLPVILRVGALGGKSAPPWNAGTVAVVHAGLVPGVPLEKQDLHAVMNMRSLVYPAEELRRDLIKEQLEVAMSARLKETSRGRTVIGEPKVTPELIDAELTRLEKELGFDRGVDKEAGLPVDGNDGEPWSEAWNRYMNEKKYDKDRTVVVYGHDAKAGLRVERPEEERRPEKEQGWIPDITGKKRAERYAFGLDSGCVYGKQLTALVLAMGSDGAVNHTIVQVDCEKAVAQEVIYTLASRRRA